MSIFQMQYNMHVGLNGWSCVQADPFRHRPKYLELLRHPSMLASVQTMSKLYKQDGHDGNRTPVDARKSLADTSACDRF